MIRVGEANERIQWGGLELKFLKDDGGWRVAGSLNCRLPFDPTGHDVLLSPILPGEKYYLDVEPPVVMAPGSEARLAASLPVGTKVFLGDVKLGDYLPAFKRTNMGPTTAGVFATFVRSGELYQPGIVLDLSIVNPAKESLCFDELVLDPPLLSVFEHEGNWVAERLIVYLGREEMDVKHTDSGPGRVLIRGNREKEISRRLKRFVERLKDAI